MLVKLVPATLGRGQNLQNGPKVQLGAGKAKNNPKGYSDTAVQDQSFVPR